MKRTYKIIGIVILVATAATAIGVVRKLRIQKHHQRLSNAADEGYEVAHDIIYPNKRNSPKHRKLRYGPVF